MPLKEKGVKLQTVFPDSTGNAGFRVERAGRLPVTMYFDSAGRVMRMVTRFALPGPVAGDLQVVRLYGYDGIGRGAVVPAHGDPARGQAVLRPGDRLAGGEATIDDSLLAGPAR